MTGPSVGKRGGGRYSVGVRPEIPRVPRLSFADVTPGIAMAPDGEPLRYRVHGRVATGATPVLVHAALLSTTEHWPFFIQHYRETRAVITWLYRGHGGTPAPRDPRSVTIEQFAADAHTVSDAAGGGPKVVAGLSLGVQVALEQYRQNPDDVQALVLICGTWGRPLDGLTPSRLVRKGMAAAARGFGRAGLASRALMLPMVRPRVLRDVAEVTGVADPRTTPPEVLDEIARHVAAMDPRVIGAILASFVEHTAEDILPRIDVPTLIIAGGSDDLTPVSLAERMHRTIRGSRLVVFPGHTHLVQVQKPDEVHHTIDAFLADHSL